MTYRNENSVLMCQRCNHEVGVHSLLGFGPECSEFVRYAGGGFQQCGCKGAV
jgi:hypothetical protein